MTNSSTGRHTEAGDPIMLVLTGLMRLGPMRISRILPNKKAVGFLVPVAAVGFAVFTGMIGAVIGLWVKQFVGGYDIVAVFFVAFAVGGYAFTVGRIEGKPVWLWTWYWLQAKLRGRVEVNGRNIKLVTQPTGMAPPKNSTVVLASHQTIVYAIPSHRAAAAEVYLGMSPLNEIMLGRMTISDSTIPDKHRAEIS